MNPAPESTPSPPSPTDATPIEIDAEALLLSLRRKQGNWVEWGQSCQRLQKAGYDSQTIFEATGFEPIQQNQIITATQVYQSLVSYPASEAVLAHFQQRGSDVLYEFRILNQAQRVKGATFAMQRTLDAVVAHEVAKAMQDTQRLGKLPDEFTPAAGDAVAYQAWKAARQKSDLQERSRLIARGLSFAESETARKELEKLLTDFTVVKPKLAPRWPVYRPEEGEVLPRLIPVAGHWPLQLSDLQAVPLLEETGPFRLVQSQGSGAWLTLPGWQVVERAKDPVGILLNSQFLEGPEFAGSEQEILIVIDRAEQDWQADTYFLVEALQTADAIDAEASDAAALDTGETATASSEPALQLACFSSAPDQPLLGKVIVVVRPKKVLDEAAIAQDLWQFEE
jgi:Rubisco accumulation factor 1 alpha helical domain/Rubisco Assembly chaperone C-terminal domain/Rubisco accumulation factor 1 helix turn helix domain